MMDSRERPCPGYSRSAGQEGFTLLEVMISLAIAGGLLVTLLSTLNYNLDIADRHRIITVSTSLAKAKLIEVEKNRSGGKGNFADPYGDFAFEAAVKESIFPGFSEISVVVRSGREEFLISRLIRSGI